MALNNGTADILAQAICTTLGIVDTTTIADWKKIIEQVYAALKIDIVITIPAASIVTTGSAVTQTGPAAPIPLSPA